MALENVCTSPKTVVVFRSLLKFLGCYRGCVKDFSIILMPLYDLLKMSSADINKGKPKVNKNKDICQLNSRRQIIWATSQYPIILNKFLDILQSLPWLWKTLCRALWCIRNRPLSCSLSTLKRKSHTAWKMSKYEYRIQEIQEYRKIQTKTNSELGNFSRSVKVISCASRTLTPLEKNYHLHFGKLEFLTSKWATTAKFSNYLLSGP